MNLSTSAANGVRFAIEAKRFAIFALVDWLRSGTIIISVIAVSLIVGIGILPGLAVERSDVQPKYRIKIDGLPGVRWLNESVGDEGDWKVFFDGFLLCSLVRRLF